MKDALIWIRRLFEDANGIPDEARVHASILVWLFVYLTVRHTGAFTFQDWGTGCGLLMAGIGAWFGFRKAN